ncbi:MAG: hypothetical protein IPK60_25025 [Sandaracinaceae bacterium]|nr:hypothetical protein [Sandaracinaceae bacterium]
MKTTLPISLLTLLAAACGNSAGCGSTPSHTVPGSGEIVAPSSSAQSYEVHEWGLIRTDTRDQWVVGSAPTPVEALYEPLAVDKPVLYFHLSNPHGDPMTLANVGVRAVDGEVREHWPLVPAGALGAHPSSLAWTDVGLSRGPCTYTRAPTATEAPCSTLRADESCESLELPRMRTADSACVAAGGVSESFLFYRSTNTSFTPPLRFARTGAGDVSVTNGGSEALPGPIFRIHRFANSVASVLSAPSPSPGATSVIGHEYRAGFGRQALHQALVAQHLTPSEANAFIAAWNDTLFGGAISDVDGVDGDRADDTPPRDALLASDESRRAVDIPVDGRFRPIESVLYFLPASDIERISQLTFSPAPSAVHRVMAVWVSLPL